MRGRRLIVTRVLDEGWSVAACAEAAEVPRATVHKWLRSFHEEGDRAWWTAARDRGGLSGGSTLRGRPGPAGTSSAPLGPRQVSYYLGVPRSTAYKVLVGSGCSRLSDFDRPTRQPIRYLKDRPGELLHIDVKKLGRIPDGGGWRLHGGAGHHNTGQGWDKLHIAVDDHSRLAYVQVHPDERGETCAGSSTTPSPGSPTEASPSRQ